MNRLPSGERVAPTRSILGSSGPAPGEWKGRKKTEREDEEGGGDLAHGDFQWWRGKLRR